ncbi:gluconate 2-dehydrogenase subunit 3 family protein [Niveispirillum fermenti]|uniref:gluconate 2-dehydrogenase subunit 3 family protein n=1 Tax=Niveispirillum fermenti TaxID=1233113 RepID=UPI003A8AB237
MMNRREALAGAIRLVGGSLLLAAVPAGAYDGTQVPDGAAGRFFTGPEMALLAELADIMIPPTGTPGARAANVHGVMDALMLDWASPATQAQFRAALAGIDRQAGADGFLSRPAAGRATLLAGIDHAAFAADALPATQPYRRLKQLVYYAYFTSQGADPDYVAVPGAYHGDLSQADYRRLVEEHR